MEDTISLSMDEYEELLRKASFFDHYIETEELTKDELKAIKEALKGSFMTKKEFLKKHPELV